VNKHRLPVQEKEKCSSLFDVAQKENEKLAQMSLCVLFPNLSWFGLIFEESLGSMLLVSFVFQNMVTEYFLIREKRNLGSFFSNGVVGPIF
jgi:hypothetical protein